MTMDAIRITSLYRFARFPVHESGDIVGAVMVATAVFGPISVVIASARRRAETDLRSRGY
jgi:hypothetical protein